MKPDKFDILKAFLSSRFDFGDTIRIDTVIRYLNFIDRIYSAYDESLTIEQNIEKWLK